MNDHPGIAAPSVSVSHPAGPRVDCEGALRAGTSEATTSAGRHERRPRSMSEARRSIGNPEAGRHPRQPRALE